MKLPALRIGNLFRANASHKDSENYTGSITEINRKQVHLNGKSFRPDDLIPIPIDEQVLLNAGFTPFNWITDAAVFECRHFKCRLNDDGLSLFCDNLQNLKPVRFVHELQNLYFDLTGEELEVRTLKASREQQPA